MHYKYIDHKNFDGLDYTVITYIFTPKNIISDEGFSDILASSDDGEYKYITEKKIALDMSDKRINSSVCNIIIDVIQSKLVEKTIGKDNRKIQEFVPNGEAVATLTASILPLTPITDNYASSDQEYFCIIDDCSVKYDYRQIGIGGYIVNKLEELIINDNQISKMYKNVLNIFANLYTLSKPDSNDEVVKEFITNMGYEINEDIFAIKCIDESIEYITGEQQELFKVFISQPMSGLSDEQIINDRINAKKELSNKFPDKCIEIIDNLQLDCIKGTKPLEYMANDIKAMVNADACYFINNWYSHRGCIVEHFVAEKYGVKILYKEDVVD